MEKLSLVKFYKKYIRGTAAKALVAEKTVFLCYLTRAVQQAGSFTGRKVYINTKVLKHLYDSKPAEEFEFVIHNLGIIVEYPDHLYKNRDAKRGSICLIKTINNAQYFCSLEILPDDPDGKKEECSYVVTAFRIRKENYLKDYKLLWSWKGDLPSS